MIRRDVPRGAVTPDRWMLVSQPEHARVSAVLGEAWGSNDVSPLVCAADESDHALMAVRREVLLALRHHDDGWIGWSDRPLVDPENGWPLTFTEMPDADARRIWTDSITACRVHGPLAGWMVASHFLVLQSRGERGASAWEGWSEEVEKHRGSWLAEWLAASEHHTQELADRALAWLQALDWISLWLCCRCPTLPGDMPVEPLEIGGDETGWPAITFECGPVPADRPPTVRITPWPFGDERLELGVTGRSLILGRYEPNEIAKVAKSEGLAWVLAPE